MTPRVLVAVPLCDYESITTEIWDRRTLHYMVRACLRSVARHVRTPITLYILTDRCSAAFVEMAQEALASLNPVTLDNSVPAFGLENTDHSDKVKHVANQILKTIELAAAHEFFYFCEQDYLFAGDALADALAAFDEIPEVNILSPFDHPDTHRADRNTELGRRRFFPTSRSTWKAVSSTNGNWIWRMSFVRDRARWIEDTLLDGGLDYRLTNGMYQQEELLLCPVRSLIQHYRLDGSNASPTFGFSPRVALTTPIGTGISYWRRAAARMARFQARRSL